MKRSVLIAFLIALVAALWLGSGIFRDEIQAAIDENELAQPTEAALTPTGDFKTAEADAEPEEKLAVVEDRLVTVQTVISVAQARSKQIILRGRTDSVRTVQLKAETPGVVVELLKAKGDPVRRGDRIARLSTQDRSARRQEALALVKQREIEFRAAEQLSRKGYKSETSAAAAEAALDAARAAQKRIEVEIAQLSVSAPFDGIIAAREAQLGAFLGVGDPVVTIVDQDPILLVGNVSEREVGLIGVGAPASGVLVDGRQVEGLVRFISPTADSATRTFRVEVEVDNADGSIRDGITAEIRLDAGGSAAHLISPAILTLNSAGELGVRIVDSRNTAHFKQVQILSEGPEGVWVAGLPERMQLITVGQEYVEDGQAVTVARADQ